MKERTHVFPSNFSEVDMTRLYLRVVHLIVLQYCQQTRGKLIYQRSQCPKPNYTGRIEFEIPLHNIHVHAASCHHKSSG